jgi:methylglyoxal synthase
MIDSDPSKALEFAFVWNQVAVIAQPTETEIAELNAIATSNNIPLAINESGMIGG